VRSPPARSELLSNLIIKTKVLIVIILLTIATVFSVLVFDSPGRLKL
jgi:hypothetical protein